MGKSNFGQKEAYILSSNYHFKWQVREFQGHHNDDDLLGQIEMHVQIVQLHVRKLKSVSTGTRPYM